MTITAEVEKPGQELFINFPIGMNKHGWYPVGDSFVFRDEEYHTVAVGTCNNLPEDSDGILVKGWEKEGGYGGVVGGVQIPPDHTTTKKGIIFTGR